MMDDDLSQILRDTIRKMRLRLIEHHDDRVLNDLVYDAVSLSFHEGKRIGRDEILERCHLSNSAEA